MQRNFAANQMPARYQMPPYSMNADMSRYMQSMGSDMSWQQQQQQSLYHQRQLHNPYQQKVSSGARRMLRLFGFDKQLNL